MNLENIPRWWWAKLVTIFYCAAHKSDQPIHKVAQSDARPSWLPPAGYWQLWKRRGHSRSGWWWSYIGRGLLEGFCWHLLSSACQEIGFHSSRKLIKARGLILALIPGRCQNMPSSLTAYSSEEMTVGVKKQAAKISWLKVTLWTKLPPSCFRGGLCHIQRHFYSWIICIATSWQFKYWHYRTIRRIAIIISFKCMSYSPALDHLCSGPKRGNDYSGWWNKEAEIVGCQRQSVDSRHDSSSRWQSCQFGGLGIKGKAVSDRLIFREREKEREQKSHVCELEDFN